MKKLVIAAFAVVAMASFSSCAAGDCYTCTVNGVSADFCKDDYVANGGSAEDWEDYKAAVIAASDGSCN